MAELTASEIKTYCRIDEDVDDELMGLYLPAAENYLDAAIDNKQVLRYDVPQYR